MGPATRLRSDRARLVHAEQAYLLARHWHQQAVAEHTQRRTAATASRAAECYMNLLLTRDRFRTAKAAAIRAGAA